MYTCIWQIQNIFQFCFMPHTVVKRQDVYNILTYAFISTLLLLSTIVSALTNFVNDKNNVSSLYCAVLYIYHVPYVRFRSPCS
jgi:hypothetical protein